MERSLGQVLELAKSRNELIPKLLGREEPYMRRDPDKVRMVDKLVSPRVKSLEVEGEDNLVQAIGLAQRHRLMVVFNHIDSLDTVLIRMALTQSGFEGFEDRFTYFSRLQIFEDPELMEFTGVDNNLPVVTPYDLEDLKVVTNEAKAKIGKKDLELLAAYERNVNTLNRDTQQRGWVLSNPQSEQVSRVLALFPEAEFQKQGIIRAPRGVSALVSRREGEQYILPIMVDGHQREQASNINFILRVGRAFDSSTAWVKGSETHPIDRVMASILKLNPSLVNPDYRDFYLPLL